VTHGSSYRFAAALFFAVAVSNGPIAPSQELGRTATVGAFVTYAPTSGHILIGKSQGRHIYTAGFQYTHRIWSSPRWKLTYQGSLSPFFLERDPTTAGEIFTLSGPNQPTTVYTSYYPEPIRTIFTSYGPPTVTPVIGLTTNSDQLFDGPRENTYAVAALPLGFRLNGRPKHRVQPTFTVDFGCLYASRDLVVDNTSKFNFMFSFGPGVEIFRSPKSSVRLEYVYGHISNAGLGDTNPGVDSGVLRLTLSRYR